MADFDWRSIAGAVAPIAPKLGGLLGSAAFGPLGGLIGGIAGRAIAGAFGVEATPEAVGGAIASDPYAADRLRKLEQEHADALIAQANAEVERYRAAGQISQAQEASDTSRIETVNQTIRAEAAANVVDKSQSVFYTGWRPATGWVLLALVASIGFAVVWTLLDAIRTNNNETLTLVLNGLVGITAFLSIPGAIVGVTAWGRSYEVAKAVQPPTVATGTLAAQVPAAPDVASIVRETIKAVRGK